MKFILKKSWLLEGTSMGIMIFNNEPNIPLHTLWTKRRKGCAREA
jgi:hypothetical protein